MMHSGPNLSAGLRSSASLPSLSPHKPRNTPKTRTRVAIFQTNCQASNKYKQQLILIVKTHCPIQQRVKAHERPLKVPILLAVKQNIQIEFKIGVEMNHARDNSEL